MPDIDSLPPPYSPTRTNGNGNHQTPSPRASTPSLAAAATMNNASLQHDPSRRSSAASTRATARSPQFGQTERRRSSAILSIYDPTLPGPGELQTGDLRLQSSDVRQPSTFVPRTSSPHGYGSPTFSPPQYRDRTPSLGEIHQELEQEQEFRVNRLLLQIRDSQAQLQAIRESVASNTQIDTSASGDVTPPTERVVYTYPPADHPSNFPPGTQIPRPSSPVLRGSRTLSRQSSRRSQTPSRTGSPGFYAQGDDFFYSGPGGSVIDSNDYYRAETQNLTRENQMLRQRIRELERQLSDGNITTTNSPIIGSNLSGPPIAAGNNQLVSANEDVEKED